MRLFMVGADPLTILVWFDGLLTYSESKHKFLTLTYKRLKKHMLCCFRNLPTVKSALILLFLTQMVFLNYAHAQTSCDVIAGDLGGSIFRDFNLNGVDDGVSEGAYTGPITINAYNSSNTLVASQSLTESDGGEFSLSGLFNSTNEVRLEFVDLPDYMQSSSHGVDSGGTVQFHSAASCGADLALQNPADVCSGPRLAAACYEAGDTAANNQPAIVSFNYIAPDTGDGSGIPEKNQPGTGVEDPASNAIQSEVGAIWGSGYQDSKQLLFNAAVLKRQTGLGPLGIGGIYVVDYSSGDTVGGAYVGSFDLQGATTVGGNTLDFGSVARTVVVGDATSNPNEISSDSTQLSKDMDAFTKVGLTGIGDIEVSEDNTTLWVVNLYESALVSVDISSYTPSVGGSVLGDVEQFELSLLSGVPVCTDGIFRPWALEFQDGVGYLGGVCSGELASDNGISAIQLFILSFNPDNVGAGFQTVVSQPNYGAREDGAPFWTKWCNDPDVDGGGSCGYQVIPGNNVLNAQPVISDIEIVEDGNLVVGVADRWGLQHQSLNATPDPDSTSLLSSQIRGDILRYCRVGGVYVAEGQVGCATSDPAIPPADAPTTAEWLSDDGLSGTGEFYFGDYFRSNLGSFGFYEHLETSQGALAWLPGSGEIVQSVWDPLPDSNPEGGALSQGFHYYSNTDGSTTNRYQLIEYDNDFSAGDFSLDGFGKGMGIGDTQLICLPPPLEIGNYVWRDLDANGMQDPNEPPLAGVEIQLWVDTDDDGNADTQIGSATTDGDGEYYFGGISDLNLNSSISLLSDTAYEIRVDLDQAALTNFGLTIADSGGTDSNAELRDSDAVETTIGPDQFAVIAHTTGAVGTYDHSLDIGFITPVSIGSYIWEDLDVDGTQDVDEPAIQGVTVALLVDDGTGNFVAATDIAGNAVTNQTTGADGLYEFDNLPPGDYRVRVTPPAGFVETPTQTTGEDAVENDSNIVSEPVTGTYESSTFTLSSLGEPNESDAEAGDARDGTADSNDDLSGNMTVDFGFVAPMSIGSFVWEDSNADGQQNANEPPINGVSVQLLVDDGTGTFVPVMDINGMAVPSVTTGPDGLYLFENLLNGDYQVVVTPPSGYFPSPVQGTVDDDVASDSNIAAEQTPNSGVFVSPTVTFDSFTEPVEPDTERGDNQDDSGADSNGNMTLDFGFVTTASIGDFVWLDLDMDGVQDANEDGIPGVEVTLTPPSGVDAGEGPGVPVSTVTDANGNYLFPNLPPVSGYVVEVAPASLPAGYVQTFDEGPGGTTGPLDHTSAPIDLSPGEFHETADFGYVPADGSIGDTIWIDSDGDGVQDPGEQGIPNVTVTLTPAPDVDLGSGPGGPTSVMTDANGNYLFTGLPLDEVYVVTVDETTLPVGYTSDPDGDGDPDVRDGNSTVADGETVITLTPDAPVNLDADFGYLPSADQNNSVGDTVWLDVDGDGTQNNGEPGLGGVTIELRDTAGTVIASTVTDANGNYLFTGIPDGLYDVVVTDTNSILSLYTQTHDNDGVGTPNTSRVNLDSSGGSPTPVEDLDQDFGYNNPATNLGSIGDTVFFDQDSDGAPGATEGIQGVVVELHDSNGVLIGSTTTDENGNYLFTNLPVSASGEDYTVVVDTSTLPNSGATSWTNSVDPNGGGDSTSVYTLTDTEPVNLDQDFGYIGTGDNSLEGTVWSDTNGDGTQQETGTFEGVTIELRDENGNVIQTTTTDANGDYSFTGLPDGIYTVVVTDEDNVLASYEHTDSPNGSSDTGDQTSKDDTGYTVDLDSGGTNPNPVVDVTGDFGYQPSVTNPISLASFVAERDGNDIAIRWTTQTEAGNLGFYIYAQVSGEWQAVSELIGGQGDSTVQQRYEIRIADSGAQAYALSDVDLYGQETLHGPFVLGRQYGVDESGKPTDWNRINGDAGSEVNEVESNATESAAQKAAPVEDREAKKRVQMQRRNELRKQRRLGQPLSQRGVDGMPGQALHDKSSLWAVLLTGLVNAVISPAQAADANAEDVLNLLVKESGVYQVSRTDLIDFGLDIDGEPLSRIALTSGGEPVPLSVTGSYDDASVFGEGSMIHFVGHGLDTLYTDTNVYTLRLDSDAARRIIKDSSPASGEDVRTSYMATKRYSPQVDYSFVSPDTQDPWYAERLLSTSAAPVSTEVEMVLDHYQPSANAASQAKLSVSVWGASDLPTADDHDVSVSVNGVAVASKTFGGLQEAVIEESVTSFRDGLNTVKVSVPLSSGQPYDLVHLNTIEVSYPRALVADGQELQFRSEGGGFVVRGFELEEVHVYRELNGQVTELTGDFVPGSCIAGAAGCAVLFAGAGNDEASYFTVTGPGFRSPELALLPLEEDIDSGQAQYLIISHGDFIEASGQPLEGLAAELASEYGSVDIVDVESIYAQYGAYRFDPEAIREYIKQSQTSRGTTTVLLVGGDVYDYRQFQNQQARSFIPSLYASTDGAVNFAPVDAKYVDVDDDNVPDMSIGRLPVRTVGELQVLLTKRGQYQARDYADQAVFAVDGYDHVQQYDFGRDADRVQSEHFGDWQVTKAYVDESGVSGARQSLLDAINGGQTLTAFFGHSSTNQWSFSGLFTGSDAGSLSNSGKPTVVTQWGCWNTYYVDPAEDSMGHRFMVEGDRGAVSVMGASTLTKADNERRLAELVFARLVNGERLGEAILNAKQEYAQENPEALDVLLGWTLLGLPELTVYQ